MLAVFAAGDPLLGQASARRAAHRAASRADAAPSTLESHRRASALIDAAVAAHGGPDALRAARHVRVTLEGHDYHRHQSRRVAAPYDSTVRRHDLMLDLARGRLVQQQTRGYPGGFLYTTRYVSDGAQHFLIDVRNHLYSPEEWPPAEQQLGNLFMLPHGYLQAALDPQTAGHRQWLGERRLPDGGTVEAVAVRLANGGGLTLGFDPTTHRLRATMGLSPDPFDGDTEVVGEWLDYRPLGGLLLPTRWVTRRAGEVVSDLRYVSASAGHAIPDSLLTPPPGFARRPAPPAAGPVSELAPGVWSVRAGGSTVLAVAFRDHVLVVDAPPRGAPEVVAQLATLAPGRPIRYVVPTHHHDDHFQGVRHFAAAGATTVTTRGNAGYFRRVVAAPASTLASWPGAPAPDARLELLDGRRRVFTDGARTVEIHDVGPSPHADEMLIAWLPAEGILFHADLIEAPTGVALRGANAETTRHLAAWIRKQGWTVRTFAGAHGTLASPTEFDALVAHPLLPPE